MVSEGTDDLTWFHVLAAQPLLDVLRATEVRPHCALFRLRDLMGSLAANLLDQLSASYVVLVRCGADYD